MSEEPGWLREANAARRAAEEAAARAAGAKPLTAAQLAEWARMAEAAAPGPWEWCEEEKPQADAEGEYSHGSPSLVCNEAGDWLLVSGLEMGSGVPKEMDEANLAFVATARTAVPALIGEVARLRALLRQFLSDARQDEVTGGRLALLSLKVEEVLDA